MKDISIVNRITFCSNDATIFNSNYSEGGAARWGIGDLDFDGLFTINDATLFNSFYDESPGAV